MLMINKLLNYNFYGLFFISHTTRRSSTSAASSVTTGIMADV